MYSDLPDEAAEIDGPRRAGCFVGQEYRGHCSTSRSRRETIKRPSCVSHRQQRCPSLGDPGTCRTGTPETRQFEKFIFDFCTPRGVLSSCEVTGQRLSPRQDADGAETEPSLARTAIVDLIQVLNRAGAVVNPGVSRINAKCSDVMNGKRNLRI